MEHRTWLAVVNEHAGKKTTEKWSSIHAKMLSHGIRVDVKKTEAPGHAQKVTAHGLLNGYTGIIAAGGDGTLNEVVNGFWQDGNLINPEAALTFVNLGTGGDFARFVYPKEDAPTLQEDPLSNKTPADPVDRLLHGQLQAVDVGLAHFVSKGSEAQSRYFINVANVGLGAESAQRVNEQKIKHGSGTFSFLKGTLATLLKYKPQHLRIVIDGNCKLNENIYGVMVCNGRYIGAGMMIAPQAQITDGLFDIIVIRKMSLINLLSQFPKIYRGTHLDIKGVEFWRGSQVEVDIPQKAFETTSDRDPAKSSRNSGSSGGGSGRSGGSRNTNLAAPPDQKIIVELDGEILGFCPASYTLLPQAMMLWLPGRY